MNLEGVELENRPCPMGCPKDDEFVLEGRDRLLGLPGEFQVVRCRVCGLMRTDPRPTPETMAFYYPEDYCPYHNTRVGTEPEGSVLRQRINRWAKHLIKLHIVSLPVLPPGRMLEIGCASGAFLHRMANQGWDVEGIEFSERAAEAARSLGYRVHAGTLESAPARDQSCDLIVGWMVLEHLHEPIPALRKLHSWARPGAWLAISVPNADAWEFGVFKDAWFALHLPNHLYHLTPETLANLLERGGWRIEKLFHQRDIGNLVTSLGYFLQDRKRLPRLAQRLINFPNQKKGLLYLSLLPLAYFLSAIGQTGRMTVWALRQDD
ncbi:MAG: class I SAM-dependent methyltransferase [Pyrinomonadaceae bacterium]